MSALMQATLWTHRRNHRANSLIATLAAWATDTSYDTGALVQSKGSAFQAAHSGTSGATAPAGTSNANDGAIEWIFVNPKSLVFLLASTQNID